MIQISPNALLNLEDIAEYAVEGSDGIYELPLKAHWISNEEAEQITYRIEFILVDENDFETTIQKGNYQAVKGTAIILDTEAEEVKDFLAAHPGYVLDEEKTIRYNPNIQSGTVLKVYFKKNVTDVTVTKLVTGKLGDLNKEFAFTWSYTYGEVEKSGVLNDLSHNESDVIEGIPVGATLILTETGAVGYTTTAKHNNSPVTVTNSEAGKTVTITVAGQDQLTVTNDKDADPDTGIHLTTWPYVMTLAFVGAGAVTFGLYKSKRRDS